MSGLGPQEVSASSAGTEPSTVVPDPAQPSTALLAEPSPRQVLAAVEVLRLDARDEDGLGDAAKQTRNIAVSDAAWALRDLVMKTKTNAKLAVEAGGLEAIVQALRQRPNSEAVQWKASGALGCLIAHNTQLQTSAGQVGGVELLISALRGHPNSVVVQDKASEALRHIVAHGHEENQALARQAGGIEAVIVAIQHHSESEALQKNASGALGGLVLNDHESQLRASLAGGIDALTQTLKIHLDSESVQARATEALGHLLARNKDNQRAASQAGAVTAVVGALRKYRTSKKVQLKALYALSSLVVDNTESQRLAGEAGGIAVVLSALTSHPSSDAVQERACEALAYLVANNAVGQNLAREAGLIETVIQCVLERYPIEAAVQATALCALGNLVANNPESQNLAREAKGSDVLTAGLKSHPASEPVNECAAVALEQFVACNRDNQLLAGKGGAIEAVVTLLRQHPNRVTMQAKASGALRSLVIDNHSNTMNAVGIGGIDEVINALRQNPKHTAEHSQAGDEVVPQSLDHQDYQNIAREAGLIQAVTTALQSATSSKVQSLLNTTLLSALGDLVARNYENQCLAGEAKGVALVVSVMNCLRKHEEVQEHASQALLGLVVDNSANKRRAKGVHADEPLLDAMSAYPENSQLQANALSTLEALRSGESFADRIMETDYGKRHQTYTAIADTATRGISLDQLLGFHDFVHESLLKHDIIDVVNEGGAGHPRVSVTWESVNMYQVRDNFVLPITCLYKCSLVEMITAGRQPPMWMVSHWWGTSFNYMFRMLQLQARSRHLHGAAAVTYWCDVFANNQHSLRDWDEVDVLRFPFARAMLGQSCMGTVLLCDPDVTALLRTWCVFEAHITQQLRCGALVGRCDKKRFFLDILAPVVHKNPIENRSDKVTITMLQDALGGSWNELSDTEGVFFPLGVATVGVGIDVRKAEASIQSDHAAILNFLTQGVASKDPPPTVHPKYDELNAFVHNVFASAELYRVTSEQPAECVEQVAALLQLRADVNSFVRQGQTPLFAAAGADPSSPPATNASAHRHLVEILLDAKADVNHVSADMKTVLDCVPTVSDDTQDDTRSLLLNHGAKTFEDAAPELERSANAQLLQILSTGFGSEQQAFIGGDAGTKLREAAQSCLQACAAILKLYHWASCRIGVQTSLRRHQGSLANERAQHVRLVLESAGCKNVIHTHCGAQPTLLSLVLSLVKPQEAPFLPASKQWQGARPRSPNSVLTLHAPGRLPPVSVNNWCPPRRQPSPSLSSTWPCSGCDGFGPHVASCNASPKPAAGDKRPHSGADLRRENVSGARAVARSNHISNVAVPQPSSNGPACAAPGVRTFQSSGSGLGTSHRSGLANPKHLGPPFLVSPGRPTLAPMHTDLDALAGDRWFQTSITCSRSLPALLSPNAQPPSNVSKEVRKPSGGPAGLECGHARPDVSNNRVVRPTAPAGQALPHMSRRGASPELELSLPSSNWSPSSGGWHQPSPTTSAGVLNDDIQKAGDGRPSSPPAATSGRQRLDGTSPSSLPFDRPSHEGDGRPLTRAGPRQPAGRPQACRNSTSLLVGVRSNSGSQLPDIPVDSPSRSRNLSVFDLMD